MKKFYIYHYHRQLQRIVIMALCLFCTLDSVAQIIPGFPKPKVYYSFNNESYSYDLNGYIDHYKPGNSAGRQSSAPSPTTDRFGSAVDALFLTPAGSTVDNESFRVYGGQLFGMIPFGQTRPRNFTFSCWINVPSVTDNTQRLIWAGSNFRLFYKGHHIFLTRTTNKNTYMFTYKFWSPASFDVPGWHQIFLVYGTRDVDNMPFIKLYVGKPGYIAYDQDEPRTVPANSSSLAWNFAGGYALLEQGNTTEGTSWQFGNSNFPEYKSPYILDDFAAWDVALTENQAKALFDCQSNSNGRDNRCWDANPIENRLGSPTLALSKGTLSPAFDLRTAGYSTQVAQETDHIEVLPKFETGVQVKVNGIPSLNGSPSAGVPLQMGNNTIKVETITQDGQTKATYAITVNRGPAAEEISATNMLSPNGDGKNDVFVVKEIELFPENTVTVYDRRGNVVYTKRGYANDWNGTRNGDQLPEGNYYYLIDFGTHRPKMKGFVTIVKNR